MDTSVLFAIAVILLGIILLRRLFTPNNLPPGPIGFPFVGYIPFLSMKLYLDFDKLAQKYGNVFSLRLGDVKVIILNDFESTKTVFAQDAFMGRPPDSPIDFSKETLETGAFDGLAWKEQRRFSLHMLRDLGVGKSKMERFIQEEIEEFLENLAQNVDEPFYISDILSSSASNNICSLVFGKRFPYDDPVGQMLTRVLKEGSTVCKEIAWMILFPKVRKICRAIGVLDVDRLARTEKDLRDYITKEIKEHEETLNPNDIRDFIDGYLLEIEKRKDEPAFCVPVLEDLVRSFFGAGSETIRMSVEWLLLTVAAHQEAQDRIAKEIDEVIGRSNSPTWIHQKSMPFTQAFIMEMSRWRTILPLAMLRYALKDGEVNGYFIPKSSQLMANNWAIHHDPKYWGQDAEEFRPERFLTEDGLEVKKFEHYLPFSFGKRSCPGEPLAKIEVFLYFISILQKFSVQLPEGNIADFDGEIGMGLLPKPQALIYTKKQ